MITEQQINDSAVDEVMAWDRAVKAENAAKQVSERAAELRRQFARQSPMLSWWLSCGRARFAWRRLTG